MFKIEFYVPESHLSTLKKAVFAAGAGKTADSDSCCWQTKGFSQFRLLEEGMSPEQEEEWKVETFCADDCVEAVIAALKENHPYENPIYQYWEVKI